MGILAGTRSRRGQNASGRWVMVPRDVTAPPRRRSRVIQRRRRIFVRLLGLVVLTLALGVVPALRWVWFVNLAADAALSLYVWRLITWKRADQDVPSFVSPVAEAAPALEVTGPSIQTFRLDPEPTIAPVAADVSDAPARLISQTG